MRYLFVLHHYHWQVITLKCRRQVGLLSSVERLYLYLKLPGSSSSSRQGQDLDPLRQPLNPLGSRHHSQPIYDTQNVRCFLRASILLANYRYRPVPVHKTVGCGTGAGTKIYIKKIQFRVRN